MKKFKNTANKANAQTIRMNTDDENEQHSADKFLDYHERVHPVSHISISLDEDIKEPKYYRRVLARITDLDESDCVELVINSYGGSVDGAVSIINALNRTEAQTVAVLDGVAASAASLIALSCNEVVVSENARLMVHSASGVTGGTMGNTAAYSAFIDAELRKLMTKVYLGYMTQEELDDVFKGCEVWHNAEQIIERLKNKQEHLQQNDQDLQYEDCNGACDDCACHAEELHYGQPLPEGIKKPTRMQMPKDWDKD